MAEQIERNRVSFPKGEQRLFIEYVTKKLNLDRSGLSKIFNINGRTLSDWRRENSTLSYSALLNLCNTYNIPLPVKIKILPQFWYVKKGARQGALVRNKLYGNPGTTEGRRRGGIVSSRRFREDPEFARVLRFKLRTPINIPAYSSKLCELIGVMLGGGYIKTNKTQVGISLNSETDYSYALYIRSLIKELFNLNPSICHEKNEKVITILVSNRNLVDFLIKKGLKPGDKVKNQVGIPKWIGSRRKYKIACLRGLMDTDGSFYSYLHRVNGKVYKNYALDFTNHSLPLLQGVRDILRDLGCTPTLAKYKVVLNKKRDISRYMSEVGSSNPIRGEKFISSKIL